MIEEDVPPIIHSHTESSSLYRKIHMKIGIDQGLGGASLQIILTTDLFLLLQALWTLQSSRGSGEEKEEEEISSGKSKNSKKIDQT